MTTFPAHGLFDDHVHSSAGSADARMSVHALCATAVARGLRGVCITDHLDFDRSLPEYGFYHYDWVLREIELARKAFAGQLEIRMGLEVDCAAEYLVEMRSVLLRYPVDFLLGAIHYDQGVHFTRVEPAARRFTADELSGIYRRYFAALRAVIRSGLFDSLAHLDYPGKLGFRTADGAPAPGYTDELEETLALAVEYGVGIEINTKRSRAGAPLAAPEAAVVRYVALGGRTITLGSDAHLPEQVADGLELGWTALRQAGLPGPTIFRNRRAILLTE